VTHPALSAALDHPERRDSLGRVRLTQSEMDTLAAALPPLTRAHYARAADGRVYRPSCNAIEREVPLPIGNPEQRIEPEADPSYPCSWHGLRGELHETEKGAAAAAHLAAVRLATARMARTAKRTGRSTAALAATVADTHHVHVKYNVQPRALEPLRADEQALLRQLAPPTALPPAGARFYHTGYPHLARPPKRLEPLALSPRGCFHSEHFFAKNRLPG